MIRTPSSPSIPPTAPAGKPQAAAAPRAAAAPSPAPVRMDVDELFIGTTPPASASNPPGGRTASDVRRDAETLWLIAKPVQPTDGFRTTLRDGRDANSPGNAPLAKQQLASNAPLEQATLAKLDAAQKVAYEHIKAQTEQDPAARLALQVLLIEGKLIGAPLADDGKTLLQTLDRLASEPIHASLKRGELVSDLLQEIALPSIINQHNKGTCTVSTLQILMALTQPAEYARIVAGLASPQGSVNLANGDAILREPGTETADGTRRTASARLWQASLMEYGNGDKTNYDNAKDVHVETGGQGLGQTGVQRVLSGLIDGKPRLLDIGEHPAGQIDAFKDSMLATIRQSANGGSPVPVALRWGKPDAQGKIHGVHEILVTRIADDQVYFSNPWGTEDRMALTDLKKRIIFSNVLPTSG
ncbi:hypothetical protein J7643_06560 [bacterium]|nr:hypothetical protein [bacterium]